MQAVSECWAWTGLCRPELSTLHLADKLPTRYSCLYLTLISSSPGLCSSLSTILPPLLTGMLSSSVERIKDRKRKRIIYLNWFHDPALSPVRWEDWNVVNAVLISPWASQASWTLPVPDKHSQVLARGCGSATHVVTARQAVGVVGVVRVVRRCPVNIILLHFYIFISKASLSSALEVIALERIYQISLTRNQIISQWINWINVYCSV